jgi:hypothetical protein
MNTPTFQKQGMAADVMSPTLLQRSRKGRANHLSTSTSTLTLRNAPTLPSPAYPPTFRTPLSQLFSPVPASAPPIQPLPASRVWLALSITGFLSGSAVSTCHMLWGYPRSFPYVSLSHVQPHVLYYHNDGNVNHKHLYITGPHAVDVDLRSRFATSHKVARAPTISSGNRSRTSLRRKVGISTCDPFYSRFFWSDTCFPKFNTQTYLKAKLTCLIIQPPVYLHDCQK